MPPGGRRNGAGRKLGTTNTLAAEMRERAMGLEALEQSGQLSGTVDPEGRKQRRQCSRGATAADRFFRSINVFQDACPRAENPIMAGEIARRQRPSHPES